MFVFMFLIRVLYWVVRHLALVWLVQWTLVKPS